MKILLLADEESKSLWDYFEKEKLEGIDLIISCGDLKAEYLSFLATFTTAPVLYVHGNHDHHYDESPPEGCICIDDLVYTYQGLRIAGLGGCMRYNNQGYQYTEREMRSRVQRLRLRLLPRRKIDILVTHAPAAGMGDGEDIPHRGFQCFYQLLDHHSPKYFVHGHVHLNYNWKSKRINTYKDTTVINAFGKYMIDTEEQKSSTNS